MNLNGVRHRKTVLSADFFANNSRMLFKSLVFSFFLANYLFVKKDVLRGFGKKSKSYPISAVMRCHKVKGKVGKSDAKYKRNPFKYRRVPLAVTYASDK